MFNNEWNQQFQQGQQMNPIQMWNAYQNMIRGGQQNGNIRGGQANPNLVFVESTKEAKEFFVMPGQTVWIMIEKEMKFAIKSVDPIGKNDFKLFSFSPCLDDESVNSVQNVGQQNPNVTFQELTKQILAIVDKMSEMEEELKGMKEGMKDAKSVKSAPSQPNAAK